MFWSVLNLRLTRIKQSPVWPPWAQTESSYLNRSRDANNLIFVRTDSFPILYFYLKPMPMRRRLKHTNLHCIMLHLITLPVVWS